MKKRWIIILISISLLICLNENRTFYYTSDGKCFTVWKTFGNICYTIPYKYFGILKPSDNYLQTNATACIDIFWIDSLPQNLYIRANDYRSNFYIKIINNKPKEFFLYNYYDDEEKYKEMLFKSNHKDYLNGIDIDLASNRLIRKYLSKNNLNNN